MYIYLNGVSNPLGLLARSSDAEINTFKPYLIYGLSSAREVLWGSEGFVEVIFDNLIKEK